jgi:hypothetical protein
VDRWAGLSWNDYQSRLSAACTSTQLYKDAVAKKNQSNNDSAFATACKENTVCFQSVDGMKNLAARFTPQSLSDLIDREGSALSAAKTDGRSYFVKEPKLSPSYIAGARAELSSIEAGIDVVQSIHANRGSGWTNSHRLVHGIASVQGFDSYAQGRESIAAYKRQLDRINPIISLDLREVSCSYDARGRFRKYELPKLSGDVKLNAVRQNTVTTKVKVDTRVSQ